MVTCVIPAKSTSKRIPGKNFREFLGKPIIEYSLETAKAFADKIVVSTDSDHIGAIAARNGAVYHARDPKLCEDDVPMYKVVLDVLDKYETDVVVMLYATAPFARSVLIRDGINAIKSYDVALSIYETPPTEAALTTVFDEGQIAPKFPSYCNNTQLSHTYHSAGQWYATTPQALRQYKSWVMPTMHGVIIPAYEAVDIDTEEDWRRAELLYTALHHQDEIEWLRKHDKVVKLLQHAEMNLDYGKVEIEYANGKWQDVHLLQVNRGRYHYQGSEEGETV